MFPIFLNLDLSNMHSWIFFEDMKRRFLKCVAIEQNSEAGRNAAKCWIPSQIINSHNISLSWNCNQIVWRKHYSTYFTFSARERCNAYQKWFSDKIDSIFIFRFIYIQLDKHLIYFHNGSMGNVRGVSEVI